MSCVSQAQQGQFALKRNHLEVCVSGWGIKPHRGRLEAMEGFPVREDVLAQTFVPGALQVGFLPELHPEASRNRFRKGFEAPRVFYLLIRYRENVDSHAAQRGRPV